MADKEIWADVRGFEGLYQVSNLGNLLSLRTGKLMSSRTYPPKEYIQPTLYKEGKSKHLLHRLVAAAFVDGYEPGKEVNHKNGCKTDNRAENLEWVTSSENKLHGCYVLGQQIKAVTAIGIDGSRREYRSISEATRDGFKNSRIHLCLKHPNRIFRGYYWRRTEELSKGEKNV